MSYRIGLVVALLSVGLAVSLWLFVREGKPDEAEPDVAADETRVEKRGGAAFEVKRDLKLRVAKIRAMATVAKRPATVRSPEPEPEPQPMTEEEIAAYERQKAQARMASMEAALAAARPDRSAAETVRREITARLARRGLAGSRVVEVACGAAFCRATLRHRSAKDREAFHGSEVFSDPPWNRDRFGTDLARPGFLDSLVYFSINGRELPAADKNHVD